MSPVYEGGGKILCDTAGKPFCDPVTGKMVWKITTGTPTPSVSFRLFDPQRQLLYKAGQVVTISEIGFWPGDGFCVGIIDGVPYNDDFLGGSNRRLTQIRFYGNNPADAFTAGTASTTRGALFGSGFTNVYLHISRTYVQWIPPYEQVYLFTYTFDNLIGTTISGTQLVSYGGSTYSNRLAITASMAGIP